MDSTVRVVFLGNASGAVRSVSRLEGAFGSLGRTSKLVAGALGVALVGGLVIATKKAIGFQKAMELIGTQAGASRKEVENMSRALLKLAPKVGTGPEELAKGLYHIESAGIRGAKALAVLEAAAKGAKVGQADLESVTNALVAAQKSGIAGAGSMEHAMAVLNATVGAGNMRMGDLAAAMSTGILAAAKTFGISIQDVGAALATMTIQGVPANEAATRLRMTLSLMAAPTGRARKALEGIGLSADALANTMRSRGLIPALQELHDKLSASGLNATKQAQVITAAFGGGRTSAGILTLLQHIDDMRGRLHQITATTGLFADAWKRTTQSIAFQLDKAKAALAAAAIPIGQLLFPAIAKAAGALGDVAGWLVDIGKATGLENKLGVIGAGFKTLGDDAAAAFDRIMHGYDAIGRHEGNVVHIPGLGDSIIESLKNVDWGAVGGQIVDGIAAGIRGTAKLGIAILGAVERAMSSVDWAQVGIKAGPALAAAIASAFVTITDPIFWAHHWQLALAVATVAVGGPIGRAAARFGAIFVARLGGALVTAVLRIGELLGLKLGAAFLHAVDIAVRVFAYIGPKLIAVLSRAGDALGAIASRIAGRLSALLKFTLKVLGVEAAIHAITNFATTAGSAIGSFASTAAGKIRDGVIGAIHALGGALGRLPGQIAHAFVTGPIHAVESAINAVKRVIEWLLHHLHTALSVSVSVPGLGALERAASLLGKVGGAIAHGVGSVIHHIPGLPGWGGATGGFVPGAAGQPIPIVAHAGEVILNQAQQQALGGQRMIARMFGFTGARGPGSQFAAGGFVGAGGGGGAWPLDRPPAPHRPGGSPRSARISSHPHPVRLSPRTRALIHHADAVVTRLLSQIDEDTFQEGLVDRQFSDLETNINIDENSLEFILTDPTTGMETVNFAAVSKKQADTGKLIEKQNALMAIYADELEKRKQYLAALNKAIEILIAAIQAQQQIIKTEEQTIATIRGQIQVELGAGWASAVHGGPGPNTALIGSLTGQIPVHQKAITDAQGIIKNLTVDLVEHRTAKAGEPHNIATSNQNLTEQRTRLRQLQTDRVVDVKQLEVQVASDNASLNQSQGFADGADAFGGGTGGVTDTGAGGAAGTDTTGLAEKLAESLRKVADLKLQLGIQNLQLPIIGAFHRGTLHVPMTGAYMLEAGERVTPRQHGGDSGGPIQVTVENHYADGMEWIGQFVETKVRANDDRIIAKIGYEGDRRQREGRY